MQDILEYPQGGYRFIKGSMAYSLGVAALPGYRLERVRFGTLVPLDEAFARVANLLAEAMRPPSALAACELRSPHQFTEAGFRKFNDRYFTILRSIGISSFADTNPISRTNVCPSDQTLTDVCMYAFSYTVEDPQARPCFVIAGAVDLMTGDKPLQDLIVAPNEIDLAGIKKKASFALDDLEKRLSLFGFDWSNTTGNGLYCPHDIFSALTDEISVRGASPAGTTWHLCRPPIDGLEFEIDTRSISIERTI
jgi:hypothetical protein